MSPILPLTAADLSLLALLIEKKEQETKQLFLTLADINFFLCRISGALTGTDGVENGLPSSLAKMAERYEQLKDKE